MVMITLCCQLGLTTEVLMKRMVAAAQERGIEVDINAMALDEFSKNVNGTQALLIGPQVSYMKSRAEAICKPLGIPVEIIDFRAYGTIDGSKVLDQALRMIADSQA